MNRCISQTAELSRNSAVASVSWNQLPYGAASMRCLPTSISVAISFLYFNQQQVMKQRTSEMTERLLQNAESASGLPAQMSLKAEQMRNPGLTPLFARHLLSLLSQHFHLAACPCTLGRWMSLGVRWDLSFLQRKSDNRMK